MNDPIQTKPIQTKPIQTEYVLVKAPDRFDTYKHQLLDIQSELLDLLYYLDEDEYCYFIDYEKNKNKRIEIKLPRIQPSSRRGKRYINYLLSDIDSMVRCALKYRIRIRYIK